MSLTLAGIANGGQPNGLQLAGLSAADPPPQLYIAGISAAEPPTRLFIAGISAAEPPPRLVLAGIGTVTIPDTTIVTPERAGAGPVQLYRKDIGSVTLHRKGAPLPIGVSGAWTIDFEDDFETLDTTVWTPLRGSGSSTFNTPFNPSSEDAAFATGQVSVSNSKVVLSAIPQPILGSNNVTYPYTSGTINSEKGYSFMYGFAETRMAIPVNKDWWPAWWMVAAGHWPPEIDMAEFFSNSSNKLGATANLHWLDSSNVHQQGGPKAYGAELFDMEYHVYGMLWTATSMQVFFDGWPGPKFTTGVPTEPMSFIYNLSLRKGKTPVAAHMSIDYLRVWKPV